MGGEIGVYSHQGYDQTSMSEWAIINGHADYIR